MDTTASLLLLVVLSILVIWIALFVRKTIKEEQKRKREEQKRKAEEQRIAGLKKVGENIPTTVRYADEHSMRTEGRHPDTGQLLSFVGMREPGQKQYSQGNVVFVLVDRQNPSNYMIQWEPDPQLPHRLERINTRLRRIEDDPLPVINNRIRRSDILPPVSSVRQLKNHWLLDDELRSLKIHNQRGSRLKKQKCFFCHGKGTITSRCTQCNGKGREKIVEYKLGRRHVSKQACSACFGSGKSFPDCPYCDGKGFTLSI